jgi:hypothetical protein
MGAQARALYSREMDGGRHNAEKSVRERRLGAALRENIKRRKAQARARAQEEQGEERGSRRHQRTPATHDSAGISGQNKED